jgi:hypothetical protein
MNIRIQKSFLTNEDILTDYREHEHDKYLNDTS